MRLTFVSLIDLVYNPAEACKNRLLPYILYVNLDKKSKSANSYNAIYQQYTHIQHSKNQLIKKCLKNVNQVFFVTCFNVIS